MINFKGILSELNSDDFKKCQLEPFCTQVANCFRLFCKVNCSAFEDYRQIGQLLFGK